jgi:hypothetical protein
MVRGILADNDVRGQVQYLVNLMKAEEWLEYWQFGVPHSRMSPRLYNLGCEKGNGQQSLCSRDCGNYNRLSPAHRNVARLREALFALNRWKVISCAAAFS